MRRAPTLVYRVFAIGILFKGLDGILEISGGGLLFLVNPAAISHLLLILTRHELSEDPQDLLATYLVTLAQHFSASTQFWTVPSFVS